MFNNCKENAENNHTPFKNKYTTVEANLLHVERQFIMLLPRLIGGEILYKLAQVIYFIRRVGTWKIKSGNIIYNVSFIQSGVSLRISINIW